jgi:hypothetical protein
MKFVGMRSDQRTEANLLKSIEGDKLYNVAIEGEVKQMTGKRLKPWIISMRGQINLQDITAFEPIAAKKETQKEQPTPEIINKSKKVKDE